MSQQEAKRLLEDVLANDELAEQFLEMDFAAAAELACGLGYDVTEKDLGTAVDERRKAAFVEPVALSEEELDQVAAGLSVGVELAPDGHEMGCFLSWHGRKWQNEHDVACSHNYYS